MHGMVAEQGVFPAAEGVERHRNGDGYVHTYHTHLDVLRERASGVAVTGEDGSAVRFERKDESD